MSFPRVGSTYSAVGGFNLLPCFHVAGTQRRNLKAYPECSLKVLPDGARCDAAGSLVAHEKAGEFQRLMPVHSLQTDKDCFHMYATCTCACACTVYATMHAHTNVISMHMHMHVHMHMHMHTHTRMTRTHTRTHKSASLLVC